MKRITKGLPREQSTDADTLLHSSLSSQLLSYRILFLIVEILFRILQVAFLCFAYLIMLVIVSSLQWKFLLAVTLHHSEEQNLIFVPQSIPHLSQLEFVEELVHT